MLEIAKISHQEVLRQNFVSGFGIDASNLAFAEWKMCVGIVFVKGMRHNLGFRKTYRERAPDAQSRGVGES